MKVVILGAGQGKRLLPLTADSPKALLNIGGRSLVGRQIDAFAACGIRDFVVVTGYGAGAMESELTDIAAASGLAIETVYNPFYAVADNLASCWMARGQMGDEFIQVNGDNVFRAELVEALLAAPASEAAVAINRKDSYDTDDMKVMLDGARLTEVGKGLPVEAVDAEAIGFYIFRGQGASAYKATLEAMMREASGLKQWFPAAVDQLAKSHNIDIVDISGHQWCEVDDPVDLQQARQLVSSW